MIDAPTLFKRICFSSAFKAELAGTGGFSTGSDRNKGQATLIGNENSGGVLNGNLGEEAGEE